MRTCASTFKLFFFGLQTNLTWLDLSFNKITKIEGLETLTKLVDLSLFNNQITRIESLDTLVDLNVISLGKRLRW